MAGVFYHDGEWHDEAPKILSPMDQAAWLSSIVVRTASKRLRRQRHLVRVTERQIDGPRVANPAQIRRTPEVLTKAITGTHQFRHPLR